MDEQFIVDKGGHKTAVVEPVDEYDELLEDLHDLAVIAERRDEEPMFKRLSFERWLKQQRVTLIHGSIIF
jgi:hypothetical protein